MADELKEVSYKKLKKRIKRTRKLLEEMETELTKRRLDRQHDSVDQMEKHLDEADNSILTLTSLVKKLMVRDEN